jgi:ketosteroid isomerase-like protein
MAEGDAELVERMIDAWNRRDAEAIAALVESEVEYVNPPAAVEPGTRRGRDAVLTVCRKQWDARGDAEMEIVRTEARGDALISEIRMSRTLHGSEARINNRGLLAWNLREGRIARMAVLGAGSTFDQALAEAGLR